MKPSKSLHFPGVTKGDDFVWILTCNYQKRKATVHYQIFSLPNCIDTLPDDRRKTLCLCSCFFEFLDHF